MSMNPIIARRIPSDFEPIGRNNIDAKRTIPRVKMRFLNSILNLYLYSLLVCPHLTHL